MANISDHYNQEDMEIKTIPTEEIQRMKDLQDKWLSKNEPKYYIGIKRVSKQEFENQEVMTAHLTQTPRSVESAYYGRA